VDIRKKKKCQQQLVNSFMIVKIAKKYYVQKRAIVVFSVPMAPWLAHLFNKTRVVVDGHKYNSFLFSLLP